MISHSRPNLLEGLNDGRGNGDDPYQPLKIYFEGVKAQDSVLTALRNLPIRDTNANFRLDCDSNDNPNCQEPFDHEYIDPNEVTDKNQVSGWLPSANTTKLGVVDNAARLNNLSDLPARVGCENAETCPKNKFIYQTYALNTEVVGPGIWTDPETGEEQEGILINLYPTQLATSSVSTYVRSRHSGRLRFLQTRKLFGCATQKTQAAKAKATARATNLYPVLS